MTQRPLLHPGATQHYLDATAYEERYESRVEDMQYFLRRLRSASSILEYGAGAGRLTLQLCQRGKSVVAVDTSQEMLRLLRHRLGALPMDARRRVQIRRADMRVFTTRQRFDAVVASFFTFCHLYSLHDVRSFLRRANMHLNPGGRLVFDLPLPRTDMPGYDPIAQVRVSYMEGLSGEQLLTQRWFPPQEVLMHLNYAGFESIKLESDFSSEPIAPETSVYTVVARKRKGS